jgi:2-polyprenyl-3-methyl-5-hydroxy-6-metoxy-1,4-benzoquinol methylase
MIMMMSLCSTPNPFRATDNRPTITTMNRGHPLQPERWGGGSYLDRFERVRRHVDGRAVLDIGAGSGIRRDDWMHGLIAEVASETVGIELDEPLAATARARGFTVISGDAHTIDVGRTFDVVFAGEVIEHLSCAGAFLDNMRRHLVRDGRLVLTTPNAFAISNFVYRIGGMPRVNRQHVCWYDEITLGQLLARHEFEVVEVEYLPHRTPGRARAAIASTVRALLPDRLAQNTLLVVARACGAASD